LMGVATARLKAFHGGLTGRGRWRTPIR
jgi:hypothetical protein